MYIPLPLDKLEAHRRWRLILLFAGSMRRFTDIKYLSKRFLSKPLHHQRSFDLSISILIGLVVIALSATFASFGEEGSSFIDRAAFVAILALCALISANLLVINSRLNDLVRSTATISPISVAYKHLSEVLRTANSEVFVFTYFTYDKKTESRVVDEKRMKSQRRRELFEEFERCIKDPKISYTRLFQVDADTREEARKLVAKDKLYDRESTLLESIKASSNARIKLCSPASELTFVIVDRSNVFLDIEINGDPAEELRPNFSVFIRDADPELVERLFQISDRARELA